jgi:hypothetical protein
MNERSISAHPGEPEQEMTGFKRRAVKIAVEEGIMHD